MNETTICQTGCKTNCEALNVNNINAINDCKVKECNCDVMTILSKPQTHSTLTAYLIEFLIVVSLISLTTSIIVIFLVFYNKYQPIIDQRSEYKMLSELNDISEITIDKDCRTLDDSDYEIMSTNPHSGDKDTNIRDF